MPGKEHSHSSIRHRKQTGKKSTTKAQANDQYEESADVDKLAVLLYIAVPLIISSFIGYFYYQDMMKNIVRKPSSSPPVITKARAEDMQRFWGTYRPGVYFGTKTRSANSPATGLMWLEQNLPQEPKIRHLCEQGDGLSKYGWLKHNGNDFGIQELYDGGMKITTEYIKRVGGVNGGDWSARITAVNVGQPTDKQVSLLYYFATDGSAEINPKITNHRHLKSLAGQDSELGAFHLTFQSSGTGLTHDHLISHTPGYEHIQTIVRYGLEMKHASHGEYVGLKGRFVPAQSPGPNMYVYQVTGLLPITIEVVYESDTFTDRPNSLQGSVLQTEIALRTQEFDKKFEKVFRLKEKGYSNEHIAFAQAAMSNMLGGVGFFFGSSKVQSVYNQEPIEYWEAGLFSAVPSRSFFPRGFLWDEGFHNLLIKEWDQELSMEIIGHWMDLINTEGWIPREQILGEEARAKVPEQFVVQRNENANPPTFFLPLETMVESLIEENSTNSREYLSSLFPRLKAWYKWFNTTQAGEIPSSYRWKGRNEKAVSEINPKTLTSGLDDYPRASHPTNEERHLDLRCWMALASKVMAKIALTLGQEAQDYQLTFDALSDNGLLNQLHWSEPHKRYADFGLHTDSTKLVRPPPPQHHQPGQPIPHRDLERVVTKEPKHKLITGYFGYVSLFPMLTQLLEPGSDQLGHILRQLKDENQLWTAYGLRSLSQSSPLYQRYNTEHDPPYWRGAIWININYLAVRSLFHYGYIVKGPHQELAASLHSELRDNIINNLLAEYRRTGYIWEQYDDKTGQGKGCHPFTGWSALVTLLMADKY
ncbi:mannosyl-oligosaccharide glucosidase-like [Watersipora subatra]|uniref:mannosyl-oligosaccharide glucosidase-like n=1 Tax=Watersipora subatra TaxID=2589382 RepID=UPI00355C5988